MKTKAHQSFAFEKTDRIYSVILCFLVVFFMGQSPALRQVTPAVQARTDARTLSEIASNNKCNEQDFLKTVNIRNQIASRSQNYINRFDFLQNALFAADLKLLACSQDIIKATGNGNSNVKSIQANLDKMTQSYKECTIVSQEENGTIRTLYITSIAGGICFVVMIILIKVVSIKNLLIKEGQKIFDDTVDALREKLIDVGFAKWEEEKWKEKCLQIQALYARYQHKEIRAAEFKQRLGELLKK
ncbi:hypothetical protein WBG78_28860 [Chryseolinea sp. T2]|uniref:hypothetical protein n=1 Tax=Chryseolinea sp. T2 TaxID=3129255 RepID=UPI003078774E